MTMSRAPFRAVRHALRAGLLLAGLLATTAVHGHAVLHEVVAGDTVTVRFSFPGGEQPGFEPYDVFAPGAETPFQSGRVNALGEVSFRPDRAGAWRLRVITADGHGADIELELDAAGAVAAVHAQHGHAHGYWTRVLAGLGYLLGIFGLLVIWQQRRARRAPD